MTGIELSSAAFGDHQAIPRRYTGEGEDISPPLTWSAPPDGTAELVLACEDPDAPNGTFLHWLVTGIDPASDGVEEGRTPSGGTEWPNGFGRTGWGGPLPPAGHGRHRYFFRLWAVSQPLPLTDRPTADTVHRALAGRELASGALMGTYQR
ncbi:YbhB/YbcL family Raf kinase inhibitor-like protein [Streptomyces sp. NRRL S-118]|uniref:YbhB/YbcL family Raf kinase inhibitor-like protein n=1 Tax=Streptomyces sp. NRRL S-118 TaxID=1463881 RepID=UPI0004C5C43E|nr:YbhB/YbcL family Raf kinase inhibitor-like protein [Streptomyces sp. NRRL S-118]